MAELNDKNPFFSKMSTTKKSLGGPQNSELSGAFQLYYVISLNLWVFSGLTGWSDPAFLLGQSNYKPWEESMTTYLQKCYFNLFLFMDQGNNSSNCRMLINISYIGYLYVYNLTCHFLMQVSSLHYFCYVGCNSSVSESNFISLISWHLYPCVSPQNATQSLHADSFTGVNSMPSVENSQGRGSSDIRGCPLAPRPSKTSFKWKIVHQVTANFYFHMQTVPRAQKYAFAVTPCASIHEKYTTHE